MLRTLIAFVVVTIGITALGADLAAAALTAARTAAAVVVA